MTTMNHRLSTRSLLCEKNIHGCVVNTWLLVGDDPTSCAQTVQESFGHKRNFHYPLYPNNERLYVDHYLYLTIENLDFVSGTGTYYKVAENFAYASQIMIRGTLNRKPLTAFDVMGKGSLISSIYDLECLSTDPAKKVNPCEKWRVFEFFPSSGTSTADDESLLPGLLFIPRLSDYADLNSL